jgi:hypothetical protein
MKKNKIVLLLDDTLKRKLDAKRREGFTLNGYIRSVLERALESP